MKLPLSFRSGSHCQRRRNSACVMPHYKLGSQGRARGLQEAFNEREGLICLARYARKPEPDRTRVALR